MGALAWKLSLRIWLGNFVLTLALERRLGNFGLGTLAWELWLGNFGLEALAWDLWLGTRGFKFAEGTGWLELGKAAGGAHRLCP